MLEILQFYVSGFWTWLGITIGVGLILRLGAFLIITCVALARGEKISLNFWGD